MATVTSGSMQFDTKLLSTTTSYTVPAGKYAIFQYYAYCSQTVTGSYTVSVNLYVDGVLVDSNSVSGSIGSSKATVTASVVGKGVYAGGGAVISVSGSGTSVQNITGVIFKNT